MRIFVAKNEHYDIVTMGTTREITLYNLEKIIGFPLKHNLDIDYRGREQVFTIEEYDVLDCKIRPYKVTEYKDGLAPLGLIFDDMQSLKDCIVSRFNCLSKVEREQCHWVVQTHDRKVIGVMSGDESGNFRSTL